MNNNVYIVDIETTGLNGQLAGDSVVEIGIARVDLALGRVYPEYSAIVRQPLRADQLDSWVFQNTSLTAREVMLSPHSMCEVSDVLREQFSSSIPVTSYNRVFDLDLFLSCAPYLWRPHLAPCIKEQATAVLSEGGKWLSAQAAYARLCPDNPARVPDGKEEHRALSDALLEGHILLRLCEEFPSVGMAYDEAVIDAERACAEGASCLSVQ